MKKILVSMTLAPLAAVLLTACSETAGEETKMISLDENGILFLAPDVALPDGEDNAEGTRATYYDGATQILYFNWEQYDSQTGKGDIAGIIPMITEAQQMEYKCKTVTSTTETSTDGVSKAIFSKEVADFAWSENTNYRAYYPYTSLGTDITAIPMDYTGQIQTGKPDMADYFKSGGTKADYYATERTSSAHLTAKTFLLSESTAPKGTGITFKMRHLGGIVRFYLALPAASKATISEIRLVATKPVFHEHATLDASSGATAPSGTLTNNIKLTIHDVTLPGTTYGNYLVAYMMAYPVALSSVLASADKLYIYVKGNDGGNDVYFRSAALAKKDISAGVLTQFAVKTPALDDPIDVVPITVQEWTEGITFSNGDDGKGTGNW